MKLTRRIRKKLTVDILRLGQKHAEKGDAKSVERVRTGLRLFVRAAFPLRQRLRTNLRCAGFEPDGLVDAYYERAIDQLMQLLHGFRADFDMAELVENFEFDNSFGILERAYAKGKGVMVIAPHLCAYPAFGCVLSSRIRCVIYSRRSQGERKTDITDAIAKIGNVELVYPPKGATKPQRLQVAIDILRQGKILFITPDTPRKPHEGAPVSILGKTAYFPSGVFIMAMRTGAPVIPAWWHYLDGRYRIRFSEPIQLPETGKIRDKAEAGMQQWAEQIDTFLREYPDMWWNWLDKRWTYILRDELT